MASIEQTKAALATVPEQQSLQELVTKSAKELGKALPEHMRPERLVRIALTNVRMNPELGKCTPASFLGALFTAAQIGIEPVAGRAYILPFNNNRKQPDGSWRSIKEAQFILGYKGVAELFYRHEKAVELSWSEVCENDEFEYQYGTDAFLKHKPAPRLRGSVIAYYVVAKLQNGGKPFMVMSKEDCMEHGRKHSKTYDKKTMEFYAASPWATSPDAMCLKTVLIQLAKLLPLSVEVQRAIEADESSRDYRDGIGDALDLPTTTNWKEAEVAEPSAPEIDKATQEAADDFFPAKKV
jgi:recombination protein RecT